MLSLNHTGSLQKTLNALFIMVICGVLLSGYSYQFLKAELPCPLCMLQRLAMIGVAMGPLLNLSFGIRMEHYALSLFSCVFGAAVSLRQIALHVCRNFSTFGEPVLGFDLYVWAFIVFTCSIFAVALLLFLYGFGKEKEIPHEPSPLNKVVFGLLALVVVGNIVTTFMECGFSPCKG